MFDDDDQAVLEPPERTDAAGNSLPYPGWEPTPEQIAAAAAEIRAGWTEADYRQRATGCAEERGWMPPGAIKNAGHSDNRQAWSMPWSVRVRLVECVVLWAAFRATPTGKFWKPENPTAKLPIVLTGNVTSETRRFRQSERFNDNAWLNARCTIGDLDGQMVAGAGACVMGDSGEFAAQRSLFDPLSS